MNIFKVNGVCSIVLQVDISINIIFKPRVLFLKEVFYKKYVVFITDIFYFHSFAIKLLKSFENAYFYKIGLF